MSLTIVAAVLVVLGGLGAAASAASAFSTVGNDVAYAERIGMGVAALLLAVLAILSVAAFRYYPKSAGLTALLAALGGAFAINAYYINTLYVPTLLLWVPGAILALISDPPRAALNQPARIILLVAFAALLIAAIVLGGVVPGLLVAAALLPLTATLARDVRAA